MKIHLLETDQKVQDYIISLIKKDLNFKDEDDDLADYLNKKSSAT